MFLADWLANLVRHLAALRGIWRLAHSCMTVDRTTLVSLHHGKDAQAFYLSGALAQLGEHLLCKQRVIGSIPIRSTKHAGRPLGPALQDGSVAQVVRAHA